MKTSRVFFFRSYLSDSPKIPVRVYAITLYVRYQGNTSYPTWLRFWDQNDRYLCLAARNNYGDLSWEDTTTFIRAWYHLIGITSQISHISNQNTSFLIKENGIHRPNNASRALGDI